jgi:hypothetical protein
MTLQERLKASAKELVRLLEEDERERDRKAERVDRLANQPIKRFFKKLEEEGMIIPVEVNLDNGKAFDAREFKPGITGGLSKSMIMLDAMREIQRLRARVATLETLLQPDQHATDNQPGNDTIQLLYQSLGLHCDPVCNSIARPCAHRGESPCPELSEILMKPDTMIVCHLIIPITGQEDRDKEPLTPGSSSEDKTRTPGQEEI